MNDHQIDNKIDNELIELEENFILMEKHINELWQNVIIPYLHNYNERQIINKIMENDYDKFYNFMINHNQMFRYINQRIIYLKSESSNLN